MLSPVTWPLVGNVRLGRMLVEFWQKGKLPPVMIWRGQTSLGKATAAKWLVQTALCRSQNKKPCRLCPACRQCLVNTHPSVIHSAGAADSPITVDQIRAATRRWRWITAANEQRWWIITDAEYLSEAASNALLKFLEEPPGDIHVILTTAQPDRLLPTVISRSAIYYWHFATDSELQAMRPDGLNRILWSSLVSRAAGRPGRLHQLLADPKIATEENRQRDLLLNSLTTGRPVRLPRAINPAEIISTLEVWELTIRELIIVKFSLNSRRLWPDDADFSRLAGKLKLFELMKLSNRYLERHSLLRHYVQPRLVLEDLQLI